MTKHQQKRILRVKRPSQSSIGWQIQNPKGFIDNSSFFECAHILCIIAHSSFGGAYDLYISNNANTISSGGGLGHNYQLPAGQQNTFFTGAAYFTVTDYEVFGLQQ